MTRTCWELNEIDRLRHLAARVGRIDLKKYPEGWSKSQTDPMLLLNVFSTLQIKPGFILRAYQFRADSNGNGVIWAMPVGEPFPDPNECVYSTRELISKPIPPAAFPPPGPDAPTCKRPDFMNAITGDGSPLSYISASLFRREALEFGAVWHGCNWAEHILLGADPTSTPAPGGPQQPGFRDIPSTDWHWKEPKPAIWTPSVEMDDSRVTVTFFTYTGLYSDQLIGHTDVFQRDDYRFESQERTLANGPGGFIH